ncbi:MAG: DUF2786 domain-containing protein [Deltaproteobacteria bacterium]|nr:DUF2786 domain-containing protein [Deltaproteobacteria bacterium]MBW2662466.1 DUF2786 domain-containing protein [Deltaproteobacteria bacterium]
MYISKNHKNISLPQGLERRILHGLACEWKTALWVLESSHRKLMHRPLFSLRNMTSRLGYWSSERREICISQNFILHHPWDAVREVLLHEIAHQFANEVLSAYGEPPHGPKFCMACKLLRANPKASGNYSPLHERIFHEALSPEDKILLKVKKLMALAESQNQHEAELAMAKAHELVAKYNVDLITRNEDRNFISVFVGTPALRHFRIDYHLARLIQDFYFVYGLWVPAYVLEKGKMGRVLEISGTVQNTKIACYVHDFVQQFIQSQWHQYNNDKKLNHYRMIDFSVGIVQGFRSKLKVQSKKEKKSTTRQALIKITDPLLIKYADHRYPHTTTLKRRVSNQNDNVLKDGMKIGRKLVISKGITDKEPGKNKIFQIAS